MDKESMREKLEYVALAAGIDYGSLEKKYEKRVERVVDLANPKKVAMKVLINAVLIIAATFLFALIGGIIFKSLAFTLLAFIISVFGMVLGLVVFVIRNIITSIEKLIRESIRLVVEFACDFAVEVDGSEYKLDLSEIITYIAYGVVIPKTGETVKRVILFAGDLVTNWLDKIMRNIIDETAKMAEATGNAMIKNYVGLKKGVYKELTGEVIVSEAASLYSAAGITASIKVREISALGFEKLFEKIEIDTFDDKVWAFFDGNILDEEFPKTVEKIIKKYINKVTGKLKKILAIIAGGFLGLITLQAILLLIVVLERTAFK